MEELFSGWMLAGGAAAATILATGWGHIKNMYSQVIGRVVVRITVCGFQADAVLMYLKHHYSASRFGPKAYVGWKLFVRPRRRVQLVSMEVAPPSGRIYWKGWLPLWVAKTKNELGDMEQGLQAADYDFQSIVITYARGTMDADAFILAATDFYNHHVRRYESTGGRRHSIRFIHGTAGTTATVTLNPSARSSGPTSNSDIRGCLSHRPLGYDFTDFGNDPVDSETAIDRLCLDDEAAKLVEEARRWKDTEQWHRERSLPWRRGYLLHGHPGTGKTALARAIAEDLDLPVFVYDLATMKNDEFIKSWNQMLAEVPAMALIEDIDAVFHGRTNVAVNSGPGLTFDCLLNCFDGVQRADGLMIVVTTNHLQRIDPAIADEGCSGVSGAIGSRPGRIDRVISMGSLTGEGREKMARRILSDWPQVIEDVCAQGHEDTPAQFQERCGRLALQLHYDDKDAQLANDPSEMDPPSALATPVDSVAS
jgi:ATPase family associated with various cellular activities (AAA)